MNLDDLNAMPAGEFLSAIAMCCGATRWADAMLASRPFATRETLFAAAEHAADELSREDWLEAFAHHPRIGDLEGLRQRFASTARWASGEQASVAAADEALIQALARGNADYDSRFGHIFIVCATGRSAQEMLDLLLARLSNDPESEWRIAAAEQRKITRLRLEKLLA